MKLLANDGISDKGKTTLENAGFEVITTRVAQEQLITYINEHNVIGILVRSATQVGKDIIDQCKQLKLIARGGVGMDNIAVSYAREKGLAVINTPNASASSVAELVFAHLYGGVRFLHEANRAMPLEGDQHFKALKKSYSAGIELRGKTLGIIGLGNIGQATAKIALGIGMKVLYYDTEVKSYTVKLEFFDAQEVSLALSVSSFSEVLTQSDFISIHVPDQKQYLVGENEIKQMKDGVGIINTSRGGAIDEVALVAALNAKKVAFAGLDVFESEPKPEIPILMHPSISLSPHIGAATLEAQERIGDTIAKEIIRLLK